MYCTDNFKDQEKIDKSVPALSSKVLKYVYMLLLNKKLFKKREVLFSLLR